MVTDGKYNYQNEWDCKVNNYPNLMIKKTFSRFKRFYVGLCIIGDNDNVTFIGFY